jgi:hypothetical protein
LNVAVFIVCWTCTLCIFVRQNSTLRFKRISKRFNWNKPWNVNDIYTRQVIEYTWLLYVENLLENVDVGLLGLTSCDHVCKVKTQLPWRWWRCVSPKRWYLPTSAHGVIAQTIVFFTVVRTRNFNRHDGFWSDKTWQETSY